MSANKPLKATECDAKVIVVILWLAGKMNFEVGRWIGQEHYYSDQNNKTAPSPELDKQQEID